MSPLFMCEADSPGSLSAEDSHSNNAGSEQEGEGQQAGRRGLKRRERNRDAARKSRKKQTERADELHEELQNLERSNSALQKEIATLKKDLHFYEATLKHHEPHCHLKTSPNSSDSFTHPSFPSPSCSQTSAASPGVPPQSPSSLPPSEAPSLCSKTLNYIEKTLPSLAVPVPTTTPGVSSVGPSPKLACSSSVTLPYSVQLSTHAAPHSLFEVKLPITSRPSSFLASVSLSPNSIPSPVTQLQSGQHDTTKTSSTYLTGQSLLPKQSSSMTASSTVLPASSFLEVQNSGAMNHGRHVDASQLQPFPSTRNPSSSALPCSLYGSPLQNPAPQLFPALPQSGLVPHPAPAFDVKLRYIHQVAPNPAPLLTHLTVPSPLNIPPPTSSSFGASFAPLLQSHPPPGDSSRDLSLSEFLEINDWILAGTSSQ